MPKLTAKIREASPLFPVDSASVLLTRVFFGREVTIEILYIIFRGIQLAEAFMTETVGKHCSIFTLWHTIGNVGFVP